MLRVFNPKSEKMLNSEGQLLKLKQKAYIRIIKLHTFT